MQKYKAVIFDLDGTLLDTLGDLTDALNYTMHLFGYPEHTLEEVRSFVGNGTKVLIERSLKDGINTPGFDGIMEEFKKFYTANCHIKTCPYPGVPALLEKLHNNGCKLSIVSNKIQSAVTELNDMYFSKYVTAAIGNSPDMHTKPAPDTTLKAIECMGGLAKEECIYIGDSEVDIETARNTGVACISVSWGFRSKALLEKLNPGAVADSPVMLYDMITSCHN